MNKPEDIIDESNSEIKFSVIIPTFNRKHYLSDTLKSIIGQTYKSTEIIVIDDGSTDGTDVFIKEEFPYVYYEHIENSGAGIARRYGSSLAKNEWIAFCDSDDIWIDDHLLTISKIIRANKEVDFVFTNHCNFKTDANRTYYNHFDSAPDGWWKRAVESNSGETFFLKSDALPLFIEFNPAWPTSTAVRNKIFQQAGKTSKFVSRLTSEDGDLTRRMVKISRVIQGSSRITTKLRKHAGNLSNDQFSNSAGKGFILAAGLRDHAEIFEPNREEIIEAVERCFLECMNRVLWSRQYFRFGLMYAFLRDIGIKTEPWTHRLFGQVVSGSRILSKIHSFDPLTTIDYTDQSVLDCLSFSQLTIERGEKSGIYKYSLVPTLALTAAQFLVHLFRSGLVPTRLKLLAWKHIGRKWVNWRPFRYMATTRWGAKISCDLFNREQSYIYYFGILDPLLTLYLQREIKKDDLVIDIGANIGYFSILASSLGARVIALEESSYNAWRLRNNIYRNNVTSVEVHNCAVGTDFDQVESNNFNASTVRKETSSDTTLVDVKPLTRIISSEDLKDAKFIRIDIEGGETPVLMSLLENVECLRRDINIIVNNNENITSEFVENFEREGFSTFVLRRQDDVEFYCSKQELIITPFSNADELSVKGNILFKRGN